MKTWFNNENMGTICAIVGLVLLGVAQFQPGDILQRLLPGGIALLSGGMFRGIVTWQNIVDFKNKKE